MITLGFYVRTRCQSGAANKNAGGLLTVGRGMIVEAVSLVRSAGCEGSAPKKLVKVELGATVKMKWSTRYVVPFVAGHVKHVKREELKQESRELKQES